MNGSRDINGKPAVLLDSDTDRQHFSNSSQTDEKNGFFFIYSIIKTHERVSE